MNDGPYRNDPQPAYAVVLLRDGRVVEPEPLAPVTGRRGRGRAVAMAIAVASVILWRAAAVETPAPAAATVPLAIKASVAAAPLDVAITPSDLTSISASVDDGSIEVCGLGRLSATEREDDDALDRMTRVPTRRAFDRTIDALASQGDERSRAVAAAMKIVRSLGEGVVAACEREPCAPVKAPPIPRDAQDELTRIASSTSDPAVYALAFRACQPPFGAVIGACQLISARRWAQLEPDNATVWLHAANEARERADRAGFEEALYRASKASRAQLSVGLTTQIAMDQVPRDTAPMATWGVATSMLGWEIAAAVPIYQHVTQHCALPALADPNRQQVCDDLANLLVERSDSLLDRGIGLSMGRKLGWPAARIAAIEEERDAMMALQMQASQVPTEQGLPTTCTAVEADLQRLRDTARHGELGALRHEMARSGIDRATLAAKHRQWWAAAQRDVAASSVSAASAARSAPTLAAAASPTP